jgi:hypothetical protein
MRSQHKEFRALVHCLRGTVPGDVEWGKLLTLANRTLVTPALADALRERPELPPEVAGFLNEIETRSIRRNETLRRQLEEAIVCLNAAGLRPILLKGTALLAAAKGGDFSRILSDLDLLLPKNSIEEAIAALGELGYGYQSEGPNSWGVRAIGRSVDAAMLDLHVRIKVARPRLDYESLAPRSHEIAIGEARAFVPSAAYQALILILHDQIQEYDYAQGNLDLRHLTDLALLDRQYRPDWVALPGLVEGRHARNAVHVQLRCVRDLLGVRLPNLAVGSLWSWLQYRRRLLQLRFRSIAPLATLLTMLFDPPFNPPAMPGSEEPGEPRRKRFWWIARLLDLSACRALPTKA